MRKLIIPSESQKILMILDFKTADNKNNYLDAELFN